MFDNINYYGIILCLNFIISIYYIGKKAKKNNFSENDIFYMILYISLGIILGGKYYTILSNPSIYTSKDFLNVGLSSLGSLLGSIIMLYIYIIQFKKELTIVFNNFIPVLPLMYGIGKIGCFLAGCCKGIIYSEIFSVTYDNISYFPIQLLESIIFLTLFVYINKLSKKQDVLIISKCLILCGMFKFLLEFLRLRDTLFLNTNQYVCIFLIIFSLLIILKNKIKKRVNI